MKLSLQKNTDCLEPDFVTLWVFGLTSSTAIFLASISDWRPECSKSTDTFTLVRGHPQRSPLSARLNEL
jgi:hypothetical protein